MKVSYYMKNKTTGEIVPIWFRGINGNYHTALAGEGVREHIPWNEASEWERVKRTMQELVIQGLYYGTWSDETTAEDRADAKRLLAEYRANCPGTAFRCITRRENAF